MGGKDTKRSSSLGRLNVKSPSPHPEAVTKEDIPAHRPQTIPLEGSLISRLLAPTQSSLARSKSSAVLSADGKDSPESHLCPRSASATAISTPPSASKGPIRSRSIDRMKSPVASGTSSSDSIQASEIEKRDMTARRRSPSPLNISKRPPSPTTENKRTQKVRSPSPSLSKTRLSSPSATQKPVPIQRPPLTANVLNVTKKNAGSELQPKEKAEECVSSESKSSPVSEKETPSVATKTKEEGNCKTISGSATAEEAAKILAENRRLAREQREREEQERIQRDQEEKLKQEEMARKAEEERAKQKEETQRLEEKRKLEEEEDHRKAQEEKIRIEKEEQERQAELQHQKEEAEAKALEEAEKQRQEREKIMHQNMQERLERKRSSRPHGGLAVIASTLVQFHFQKE
ncbi:ensconsin [Bombina bombina]|uniref:ensconsin n=1 Tax=Bombina bombina TaxID=8345 RepID=UPI00235B2A9A|nr:ensconsin [Bombina bombina]